MLIKVFDTWINPNAITHLEPMGEYNKEINRQAVVGSYIQINTADSENGQHYIRIRGVMVDEVANEINRQLREAK